MTRPTPATLVERPAAHIYNSTIPANDITHLAEDHIQPPRTFTYTFVIPANKIVTFVVSVISPFVFLHCLWLSLLACIIPLNSFVESTLYSAQQHIYLLRHLSLLANKARNSCFIERNVLSTFIWPLSSWYWTSTLFLRWDVTYIRMRVSLSGWNKLYTILSITMYLFCSTLVALPYFILPFRCRMSLSDACSLIMSIPTMWDVWESLLNCQHFYRMQIPLVQLNLNLSL